MKINIKYTIASRVLSDFTALLVLALKEGTISKTSYEGLTETCNNFREECVTPSNWKE